MQNNCLLCCSCILSLSFFCTSLIAQAQVKSDNTLPQNSEVIERDNNIQIDGGTEAGTNLFHSFEQFSLPEGKTVIFNNDLTIENIFSRVTGESISNIDGLIKANGNANLFLLNPNGIIFGENAALDIGGSFLATTANSINFADEQKFATDTSQSQPLLTISAPIGLGFTENTGEIVNRSVASPNGEVNTIGFPVGLRVQPEQTIALVGGELNLDGGSLTASGGRIELGSVSDNSIVNLNQTPTGLELSYEEVNNFQNINLANFAVVDSGGSRSGGLQIKGKNLDVTDSLILANSLGSENGQDLIIDAAESITMTGDFATLQKQTFSTGDAGNLIINAKNLTIQDGAYIDTSIGELDNNIDFAAGKPADLIINVSNSIDLIGTTSDGQFASGLFSNVAPNATNQGGSIEIETKKLTIQQGATIFSEAAGNFSSGNITINSSDTVEISESSSTFNLQSNISNLALAEGDSGDITINTTKLIIKDGANISSSTFVGGDAGDITVKASESLDILGFARIPEGIVRSGIFAQVDIDRTISTRITGNAGDLTIETQNLTIKDGGQISTAARSEGEGGNLVVNATESILLSGTTPIDSMREIVGQGRGGIFTSAQPNSFKTAGDLTVTTNNLTVETGAEISANTFGQGKGGNANINVKRLVVRDGGRIGAGSLLKPEFNEDNITDNIRGAGGKITINVSESAEIIGTGNIGDTPVNSTLFTRAEGTGDAGDLSIFTPKLTVAESGNINVSATGTGVAGSLDIDARDINLDKGSLTAETRRGSEGNITLSNAASLLLSNNSQITTNALEQATGGDITITSDVIALLDNSDITANAVEGRGGNIQITTQGIFQEPDSEIIAASELGIDGTVTFNTPDVDPASGLFELPDVPLDAAAIFAQDLCKFEDEKIAGGSSFIITGRGGLTPTSEESLGNLDRVVSWANRKDIKVSKNGVVGVRQREENDITTDNYPVVRQSQGWVTTSDGSVWLVANSPESIPQNSRIIHPSCKN